MVCLPRSPLTSLLPDSSSPALLHPHQSTHPSNATTPFICSSLLLLLILVLLLLLRPAKRERERNRGERERQREVTFDRSCSSCGMYGCVLICTGFRNYRGERVSELPLLSSPTHFLSGERQGSFRCALTSPGPISYGDLFVEWGGQAECRVVTCTFVREKRKKNEKSSRLCDPICNLLSC